MSLIVPSTDSSRSFAVVWPDSTFRPFLQQCSSQTLAHNFAHIQSTQRRILHNFRQRQLLLLRSTVWQRVVPLFSSPARSCVHLRLLDPSDTSRRPAHTERCRSASIFTESSETKCGKRLERWALVSGTRFSNCSLMC